MRCVANFNVVLSNGVPTSARGDVVYHLESSELQAQACRYRTDYPAPSSFVVNTT